MKILHAIKTFLVDWFEKNEADILGFILIFPITRKILFKKFSKKFNDDTKIKKPYIEGEFEDLEEDDERKL